MEWTGAASSRRATAGDYSSAVWFVDVWGRDELEVEVDRAVLAITKKRRTLPPLRYRRANDESSGAEKDGAITLTQGTSAVTLGLSQGGPHGFAAQMQIVNALNLEVVQYPVAPTVAKNQTGNADDAAMKTHDALQCFEYDALLGGFGDAARSDAVACVQARAEARSGTSSDRS